MAVDEEFEGVDHPIEIAARNVERPAGLSAHTNEHRIEPFGEKVRKRKIGPQPLADVELHAELENDPDLRLDEAPRETVFGYA